MTKSLFLFSIAFAGLLICISCRNSVRNEDVTKNDTTEAMRILFDSTIKLPRLPELHKLSLNNPFGDTAIVLMDSLIYKHLPKNYFLKFLTIDSICSLAQQYDTPIELLNFLSFDFNRLTDSTFTASVSNNEMLNDKYCIFARRNVKYMSFKKQGQVLHSEVNKDWYD